MTGDPRLESQVVFDGHTPESHPEEYGWIGDGLDRLWARLLRWVARRS